MALVPWPEDRTEQHTAAQLIAHEVLGGAGNQNVARAIRLGPTAADVVQRFAPLAPDPVQDEAVFRIVGWLAERTPNLSIRTGNITVRKRRYRGEFSVLRDSGAGALLSPWKVRRAGKIA